MGKTFRKRVGRRGRKRMRRMRKKGTLSIAKTVKRVLFKQAETKQYTVVGQVSVAHDQFYTHNPFVGIARGTGQDQRIGDNIRVIGIKVVYSFTPVVSLDAGQTRLRFFILKGDMWNNTYTTPTAISASALSLAFGSTRVGTEVFNRDTGAILLHRTWLPRHQTYLSAGVVSGSTTTYDNYAVLPAQRFRFWLPMRGQRIVWRSDAVTNLFRFDVPTVGTYCWNNAVSPGLSIGTLGYTVTVYYKDI